MQDGIDLAVLQPLSLAQLRERMRTVAQGCTSLARRAVEGVQHVRQRMRSASTPSVQQLASSARPTGDVQAA